MNKGLVGPSVLGIAVVLVTMSLSAVVSSDVRAQPVTWTVMIYMDGDNNLEPYTFTDIEEIEAVEPSDDVTVIALHDTRSALVGTHWYVLDDGSTHVDLETGTPSCQCDIFCDEGKEHEERNMGNGATLAEFIVKSVTHAPADRYVLVLWDHGFGWIYLCFDETEPEDGRYGRLTVHEVREAILDARETLKADGVEDNFTISILGYDACLSSMIEVAYEDRGLADYIVASVTNVPGEGWDYHTFLQRLVDDTSVDPEDLCRTIVDSYVEYYDHYSSPYPVNGYEMASMIGMSVLKVSSIDEVVRLTCALTEKLVSDEYLGDPSYRGAVLSALSDTPWVAPAGQTQPFIDFGNYVAALGGKIPALEEICGGIHTAVVDDLVVYVNSCNATNGGDMGTSGLDVYFPQAWSSVYPEYAYEDAEEAAANGEFVHYGIDFCHDTYWDEMIFMLFPPYEEPLLEA